MQIYKTLSEAEWLQKRTQDVTSTEVSALFGVNPYLTFYELWHRKKGGEVPQIEVNERMKWGTRFEQPIAMGMAEDFGVTVEKMPRYIRNEELRIGSSFDYCLSGLPVVVEIKSLDGLEFRDKWVEDGDTIEAPPHIELQVQAQLLVSGYAKAELWVLVGKDRPIRLYREPNQATHDAILKNVQMFWGLIDNNKEPPPDFDKDSARIRRIYSEVSAGKSMDATPEIDEIVSDISEIMDRKKEMESHENALRMRLLSLIGDAEKVRGVGYSVSSKLMPSCPVSYVREAHRRTTINRKKGAKNG